jgi:hypothetical protein
MAGNERWPEVGDLLIWKPTDAKEETCTGLVTRVGPLEGVGDVVARVYVQWGTASPPGYSSVYGYSPINIHNDFAHFTLVKGNKNNAA